MRFSLMLMFAAAGSGLCQTSGYWRMVDTRTYESPVSPGANTQETYARLATGATFHIYTPGCGIPLQGADVSMQFFTPPTIMVPGTPFPVSISGSVGWNAYQNCGLGYGKNFRAVFDTIAGQQDVWPNASQYIDIGNINVGVNYTGAQMSATLNIAGAANPALVPSSNWAPGPSARATLRYEATTGANVSWGWVYQWTAGTANFFGGEILLGNGVYYLQHAAGKIFGYYSHLSNGWIYHLDLGYLYEMDGANSDMYLWDFASGHWWYTSADNFPYLYDFNLNAWLFYFPDSKNPGRYLSNPRYFANLTTHQTFTM